MVNPLHPDADDEGGGQECDVEQGQDVQDSKGGPARARAAAPKLLPTLHPPPKLGPHTPHCTLGNLGFPNPREGIVTRPA